MGPIAFVLVFLIVPLAAALFAGAVFATLALLRLLVAVPTAAWAGLAVTATVVLAARLGAVLHRMPARREPQRRSVLPWLASPSPPTTPGSASRRR